MRRAKATAILFALGWVLTSGALAQSSGTTSVTEDIRRKEKLDEAIDPRVNPRSPSGSLPGQSDPSGVAGFNGPPGGIGDSVGSYGALPQGATGADIR